MKVRISDIAEKAGVSNATVSNALNGRGGVGESKLRLIQSIAREMGYVTERSATVRREYIRLVVFKRHGSVLMDTQFFAEITESMIRYARKFNCDLLITHISLEKDQDYLEQIREICADECVGIILLATEMLGEDIDLFANSRAPLLVMDNMVMDRNINCVEINNWQAGAMAVDHLFSMGHVTIGCLTASVRCNNLHERRVGFEACMNKHHLAYSTDSIWRVTPTIQGAYRDMLNLLSQRSDKLPTAFFATNDIIAVGCMRALTEKGYRIPKDISIIGMDDIDIGVGICPSLTTIRVYRDDFSRIAIQRIVEMSQLDAMRCVQKIHMGIFLVERQSVRDLRLF